MKYLEDLKKKLAETRAKYQSLMQNNPTSAHQLIEPGNLAITIKDLEAKIKRFELSPWAERANMLLSVNLPNELELKELEDGLKVELVNISEKERKSFYPSQAAGDSAGFESQYQHANQLLSDLNLNGLSNSRAFFDQIERSEMLGRIDFVSTALDGLGSYFKDNNIIAGDIKKRFELIETSFLRNENRAEIKNQITDLRAANKIVNNYHINKL